jgi:hypothetical protein
VIKIESAKDLDKLYTESEEVDKNDFAKMRSNLLLIAGEHYAKKNTQFQRLRQAADLQEQVRIRLTENHIGRIMRRISNMITTSAPSVSIGPKHKKEMQDQKAAEIHQAIWNDGKDRSDFQSLVQQWADDYGGIGEVWAKLYFDEMAGPVTGYMQLVDEMGQPIVDEMGQAVPDMDKPVHQGQLKFEEVFAFNVLRDPSAQSLKDSPYFCIRKSVKTDRLKKLFPEEADKLDSSNETPFMVFDASSGYRRNRRDEVLVKEWYFKPSPEYPKGYYYIHAAGRILDKDELPDGIFPVVCRRYENIQTKCRGISAVEPLRHTQLELNRAISKIAETQITLGDDKLILQNGAKVSAGATLPGIRTVTVSGPTPEIMPGRSGDQYVGYAQGCVDKLYQLADLDGEEYDGNLEPHTLLYRAASQKKKFSRPIKGFESFLKEVCLTYLKMAKYYFTDDMFIMSVGRSEAVNIAEFKRMNDLSLDIVVEAQSDDVETKLGRQLSITNALQYVGNQLDPEMIGTLIKQLPYANGDAIFNRLTINEDMATNDCLALDRGDFPMVTETQPHDFLVNRATLRMNSPDFMTLNPEVQQAYQQYIAAHLDIVAQQREATLRAQSGFIPDGGAMVGVDFFIQDTNNQERTRRARVPYDSLNWLIQKLQDQGTFKREMALLPESAVALLGNSSPEMTANATEVPTAQGNQAEVIPPSADTL